MPSDLSGETIRKIIIFVIISFFSVCFGYYYGLIYWSNGIAGAILGLTLGIFLTIIGLFLVSKFAGLFGALLEERKALISPEEQFQSDIQKARYLKMRKEYDLSLRRVNQILKNHPDSPEALLLKAQVVWEGFGNESSALCNLQKIQKNTNNKESSICRWADSLSEDIKCKIKNR